MRCQFGLSASEMAAALERGMFQPVDGNLQVKDLGAVLHMVGGTAASFMIFFLPGLLLVNAAIVKSGTEQLDDDDEVGCALANLLADVPTGCPAMCPQTHGSSLSVDVNI